MGSGFREFRQTLRGKVSPYLGFILYLSTLLMFELNEAVRGRLIDPKSWDRIIIIFETSNVQPVQSTDCLCCVCWILCVTPRSRDRCTVHLIVGAYPNTKCHTVVFWRGIMKS